MPGPSGMSASKKKPTPLPPCITAPTASRKVPINCFTNRQSKAICIVGITSPEKALGLDITDDPPRLKYKLPASSEPTTMSKLLSNNYSREWITKRVERERAELEKNLGSHKKFHLPALTGCSQRTTIPKPPVVPDLPSIKINALSLHVASRHNKAVHGGMDNNQTSARLPMCFGVARAPDTSQAKVWRNRNLDLSGLNDNSTEDQATDDANNKTRKAAAKPDSDLSDVMARGNKIQVQPRPFRYRGIKALPAWTSGSPSTSVPAEIDRRRTKVVSGKMDGSHSKVAPPAAGDRRINRGLRAAADAQNTTGVHGGTSCYPTVAAPAHSNDPIRETACPKTTKERIASGLAPDLNGFTEDIDGVDDQQTDNQRDDTPDDNSIEPDEHHSQQNECMSQAAPESDGECGLMVHVEVSADDDKRGNVGRSLGAGDDALQTMDAIDAEASPARALMAADRDERSPIEESKPDVDHDYEHKHTDFDDKHAAEKPHHHKLQ